jgi:hypothetical protein
MNPAKPTLFITCLALVTTPALAWECEHERNIERELNVGDARELIVEAAAGDLEIKGVEGLELVRARAKICASSEDWMNEAELLMEGGGSARIATQLPRTDGMGWGSRYAYMDLVLEVPADLPLDVRDSSGDVEISGVASLALRDSSGDIEVEGVLGDVILEDSSGDIDLLDIEGNVTVEQDSSGDIDGRGVRGMVLVARDSSGDIRFRDVRDDFVVERDSSGDIVADRVGGDFRVLKDSSGEIRHDEVAGEVAIPEEKM